jgi:hypothetical protein
MKSKNYKDIFLYIKIMVFLKEFIISDKDFSGFSVKIDLDEINNLNEIVNSVINELKKILNNSNLEILLNRLNRSNYHIHDFTFEDILVSNTNKFYVCNHNHS